MSSLPLHPAVVHIPLALAFIMPLLAIGAAYASLRGTGAGRRGRRERPPSLFDLRRGFAEALVEAEPSRGVGQSPTEERTLRVRPRAWLAIVALQAVLLAAGLVAMNTGEREEDRVESAVPHAAMEKHEEAAEQFVQATGLTLGLMLLVLAGRRPAVATALMLAAVAGTVVVTALAIRVGHAGGELVYVHNAGAVYAAPVGRR